MDQPSSLDKPDSAALDRIEPILGAFEAAWRSGTAPPDIEAFPGAGGPDRLLLVEKLVLTDLEFRLKAGQDVRLEEYLRRFPELAGNERPAGPGVVGLERAGEKGRAARPQDRAARDCGGFLYHRTWDSEGSQTRRWLRPRLGSGTTAGGVVPGRWRGAGVAIDSGAETAFLVKHDKPDARAAQRRPGAEHRARPGPPQPSLKRKL